MKVLMTYHGYYNVNSGAPGAMITIGERLRSLGAEVDYFTYSDLPSHWDMRFKSIVFPFLVYQHIQRYRKWDVLDAASSDGWVVGAKRPKGLLFFVRSDGLEHLAHAQYLKYSSEVSWKYKLWWGGPNLETVKASIKSADHIFALNDTEKDFLHAHFSIPPDRVTIAYHDLPDHFKHLSAYQAPAQFKILYTGSWLERKGVDYLRRALETLTAQGSDFTVTLAGVGVEVEIIRRSFSAALNARTLIVPFVPNSDLPELYRSHSVVVFPSFFEGFSRTLIEALACGIPVISTPAGAAAELIADYQNGILIPYQDPAAICTAVSWVQKHPHEAVALGILARQRLERLDLDRAHRVRLSLYHAHRKLEV